MKVRLSLCGSAIALAAGIFSSAAYAQTGNAGAQPASEAGAQPTPSSAQAPQSGTGESDNDLEEIMVTARRTSENLMQVPVALSAVSGRTLERNGITALNQVERSVPNFVVLRNSIQPNLSIRGAFTYTTNYSVDSAVGISLDELFLGSTRWIDAAQFDISQIEILRGPQGTYFGKNTTAGLVNITSRGPTDRLEGYARAAYEFTTRERSVEAAVGGPISDTFGVRIAARFLDSDGFLRNTRRDDREVSERSFIGRLTAVWQPSDSFTATFKLQHENTRYLGAYLDTSTCTAQLLTPLAAINPTEDCTFNGITATGGAVPGSYRPFDQGRQSTKSWLGSMRLQAELGRVTLTSVTGYTDLTSGSFLDTTFTGLNYYSFVRSPDINRQFSQEVRLQTEDGHPLRLVIGAYYAHATFQSTEDQTWDAFAARGINLRFTRDKDFHQTNDTLAAFGELTWRITDELRLTAGGRVTNDQKDAVLTANIGSLGNPFDANATAQAQAAGVLNWLPIPRTEQSRDVTRFTPSISLQYVLPNLQIYASYREGFKSGGFDMSIPRPALIATAFEFQDETAESFEAGVKTTLLNGRLRLLGALFRTNISNLQLTATIPPATSLFRNAGSVRNQGVEFEAVYAAPGGFQLNLAAAFLDAKFRQYDGAPCFTGQTAAQGCVAGIQNVVGRQVAFAPRVSISGGASWEGHITDSLKLGLFADASYRSSNYLDLDYDPLVFQDPVTLFNARISLGAPDDRWRVSLIGRNIFDHDYAVGAADIPLFSRAMALNHGLPRTVLIQVETNF